mmetsp:Transcript_80795/g.224846  ORF Transcript_80795/g.224846 Transcript_80795/m.224846 type:complete len:137 (-) Transcript_80795:121-531(-)
MAPWACAPLSALQDPSGQQDWCWTASRPRIWTRPTCFDATDEDEMPDIAADLPKASEAGDDAMKNPEPTKEEPGLLGPDDKDEWGGPAMQEPAPPANFMGPAMPNSSADDASVLLAILCSSVRKRLARRWRCISFL